LTVSPNEVQFRPVSLYLIWYKKGAPYSCFCSLSYHPSYIYRVYILLLFKVRLIQVSGIFGFRNIPCFSLYRLTETKIFYIETLFKVRFIQFSLYIVLSCNQYICCTNHFEDRLLIFQILFFKWSSGFRWDGLPWINLQKYNSNRWKTTIMPCNGYIGWHMNEKGGIYIWIVNLSFHQILWLKSYVSDDIGQMVLSPLRASSPVNHLMRKNRAIWYFHRNETWTTLKCLHNPLICHPFFITTKNNCFWSFIFENKNHLGNLSTILTIKFDEMINWRSRNIFLNFHSYVKMDDILEDCVDI
jgi:hypothetical protein